MFYRPASGRLLVCPVECDKVGGSDETLTTGLVVGIPNECDTNDLLNYRVVFPAGCGVALQIDGQDLIVVPRNKILLNE